MSDFLNDTVVINHVLAGNLAVAAGVLQYPVPFASDLTNVSIALGTAPATNPAIFNVRKNGVALFATTGRPQVAAAATGSSKKPQGHPGQNANITTPYVVDPGPLASFAAGDTISFDVEGIGTGTVGANAVLSVTLSKK